MLVDILVLDCCEAESDSALLAALIKDSDAEPPRHRAVLEAQQLAL